MAELHYSVTQHEQDTIFALEGEIDVSNSHHMRTLLLQALEKTHRLLLDLRAVASMDSSGITVLIEIHDKARSNSKFFQVLDVSPRLGEALKLLCLDTLLMGGTAPGVRHSITRQGEDTLLSLEGEIDFFNVHLMSHILMQTLGQARQLSLDLQAVTSMDSSGVNALLEAYNKARDSGKRLRVVAVSERVRLALKLLCLDTLLMGGGAAQ